MQQPSIKITEAARCYLQQKMTQKEGVAIRLSVKKTGCSGFAYSPEIISEVNPDDVLFEVDDLRIYIDKKWQSLFTNIQIDYIDDQKSGLKQKKLIFINPIETSRCGCGESFHIEADNA